MKKRVLGFTVLALFILSSPQLWAQPSPSKVGATDDNLGTGYNNGMCIDRAPDGTVMAIWGTSTNHDTTVMWSTYDDLFGVWNTPQTIDKGTPTRSSPALVADDNSHFHATWSKNWRIYYSQYNGVEWSTPVMVQKDTLQANQNSIVIDSNGIIWIAWYTDYQADNVNEHFFISHSVDNGVTWSDADTLFTDVVPGIITSVYGVPHLAVGPNGKVCVSVREKDTNVSNYYQLFFQEYDGAQWLHEETITDAFHDSINCYQASVGYDSQGKRHCVFYTHETDWSSVTKGQIYYTSKVDDGEWSFPVAITADPLGVADYPAIVVGENDALYVAYLQSSGGIRNMFAKTSNDRGKTWSDSIKLSDSATDINLRGPDLGKHPRAAGIGGTSFEGGADMFWIQADATETDGFSVWYGRIPYVETSSVESKKDNTLPESYRLSQNFPNPFNPSTVIEFQIPANLKVQLKIYNMRGEQVATLIDGNLSAGYHQLTFDASQLTSGVYFYKLIAANFVATKKMVYMK